MRTQTKRTRHRKRFAGILCTVVMALSCIMPAFADNAHITFTNVESNQPDLYITKTVESAVEGYSVPDDVEFSFVLKWDLDKDGTLEYASNEKYTVYNADGSEVYNYDSTGTKVSFKTSSDGSFTLKAGQTAKFEWVGTGVAYEVTEAELDGWYQETPATGTPATGTVDAGGTYVTFHNVYVPETEEEEPTTLKVQKNITWPEGYEQPDFSAVEFTFAITLDDEPLSNTAYTVYDTDTDTLVSTGTTDENGYLVLLGGQYALFEDIESYLDYSVTELETEGWEAVGDTAVEGGTTFPLTYAIFTNRTASMIVTKTVDSEDEADFSQEFTFYLTDENGDPMDGVSYYLYNSDGELVEEDALATADDGSFTLAHGQYAIFTGLAVGTEYSVIEETAAGYTADPEDGYTGQEVQETPATLTFTNTKDVKGSITIIKKDADGQVLSGVAFELRERDDTVVASDTTDDDGTIVFSELEPGTYYIYETSTEDGNSLLAEKIEVTIPLVLTKDEVKELGNVDTSNAVYVKSESSYYFYNLTYEVTNTAQFTLPKTGASMAIPYVLIGIIAAVAGIAIYETKKKLDYNKEVKP